MENNNFILEIIKNANDQADSAMEEFDRKSAEIERLASNDINLYGSTALSQVAELVEKSRDACDDLYIDLQALVVLVNEKCRPLVNDDTPAKDIKEIAECISYLNSESKIKNNFSASLNNSASKDVARVSYNPSLESQMIEKYWTNLYESLPEAIKEKEEAEKKAEQDKKDYTTYIEKLKADYPVVSKKHIRELNRIKKLRKQEFDTEIEKARKEAVKLCGKRLNQKTSNYQKKLQAKQKELDQEIKLKESLSAFAFKKKKASKSKIEEIKTQMNNINIIVEQYKCEYQDEIKNIDASLEQKKKDVLEKIARKYPFPKTPEIFSNVIFCRRDLKLSMVHDAIKNSIYDYLLRKNEPQTFYNVVNNCDGLSEMYPKQVYSMVNALVNDGLVEKLSDFNDDDTLLQAIM